MPSLENAVCPPIIDGAPAWDITGFTALASAYYQAWGQPCVFVDTQGEILAGYPTEIAGEALAQVTAGFRRQIVDEAVRWGEPSISLSPEGAMLWAAPVMHNAQVLGGVIVVRTEQGPRTLSPGDVRQAAFDLLIRMEQANLTNAAFLELQRMAATRESRRAEAIHELKEQNYQSIRDIYLIEEPALIAAIKRGDRAAAREIINRVLVGIYFMGRNRPSLLKSFLLELVVTMSRSAVEAGGDPTMLLGTNYSSFTELSRIETEEALCEWLVSMLERIMDAIKASRKYPISMLLGAALQYMQEHLHEDLSRDDVAAVACLSPSHFSRVVKSTFNRSFTELLSKLRVDKAREMLILTEKSIIQIGFDSGFSDQSYFTKVFQKYTGRTPGEYRRQHHAAL